jgi:CHAT domain-containing protein
MTLGRAFSRRSVAVVCGISAVLAAAYLMAGAKPPSPAGDDLDAVNQRAAQLFQDGDYAEAATAARRAAEVARARYGDKHLEYAKALGRAGNTLLIVQRFTEVEPLFKDALAIATAAQPQDGAGLAQALEDMGRFNAWQGRFVDAEPFFQRALPIREKSLADSSGDYLDVVRQLGSALALQGRNEDTEHLLRQAIGRAEAKLGPDHPYVAALLTQLAWQYALRPATGDSGKPNAEVEAVKARSAGILERAMMTGRLGPTTALAVVPLIQPLADLGASYASSQRPAEAEQAYRLALDIRVRTVSADHAFMLATYRPVAVNGLLDLYESQRRSADFATLAKRAIDDDEKRLPTDTFPELTRIRIANLSRRLANVYAAQHNDTEAEASFKRAVTTLEAGTDPLQVADVLAGGTLFGAERVPEDLASFYEKRGRMADADTALTRAIAIREKIQGAANDDLKALRQRLAQLRGGAGVPMPQTRLEPASKTPPVAVDARLPGECSDLLAMIDNWQEAAAQKRCPSLDFLRLKAAALGQQVFGRDNPMMVQTLTDLAKVAYEKGDWANAVAVLSREMRIIASTSRKTGHSPGPASIWLDGELRPADPSLVQIKAAYRLAATDKTRQPELQGSAFAAAQQANLLAAAVAIGQMSNRMGSSTTALAVLVRERQDLAGEWERLDMLVSAALAQPNQSRNLPLDKQRRTRMDAIDTRRAEIDKVLAREYPDYAALANPEPSTIAQVQARLGPNEALLLLANTPPLVSPVTADMSQPAETFAWAITKTQSRWVKAELAGKDPVQEIEALRCGLDSSNWATGSETRKRCLNLLGVEPRAADLPPFDLARAHALYRALFGQLEDVIAGKQLLVVPTGPFTNLPFEVLVTQKPAMAIPASAGDFQGVKWLGRDRAITVLPSVASLKALRDRARASAAGKAFIGFGNPLLDSVASRARANLARQKQRCGNPAPRVESAHLAAAQPPVIDGLLRGNLADVTALRQQVALPETADELCAVAREIGAGDEDVLLGTRMTEAAIKDLSGKGSLRNYRVIHFATHGLVSGETALFLTGRAEPALLFTPPQAASETDDGLLTASEVTQLKLDADWIVMSACNTAAGGAHSSEALSGLAKAFFYAGARSLLVSHWAVDSDAAVAITTGAFAAMKADSTIGRAEALRRSLVALMDKGGRNAHPSIWAPFVLVGEGGN